ncbi:hypothetical protein FOA52_013383 [Chlamydomonas sp. UWO 241]|nr:hypothetical protein FOA52_013383 [Chlamydomonas sp. UWO 241]
MGRDGAHHRLSVLLHQESPPALPWHSGRSQDPLTPFRAGDAGYTFARDDAPAPAERSVFVFGDSLSDTGGVYGFWKAMGAQGFPEAQRVPLARLGCFQHQWSNGNTWPLRIKEALPEALKNVEACIWRPSLPLLLRRLPRGTWSAAIIAAGGNDLVELNNPSVILNAAINPGAPLVNAGVAPTREQLARAQQVYVGNIVATLVKNAFDLAASGMCDEVMLWALPPLHRTPTFIAAVTFAVKTAIAAALGTCPPWPTPCPDFEFLIEQFSIVGIADAVNGLKAAVVGINGGVAQSIAMLAGMSDAPISIIDAYAFFNGILDDPAMYGFIDTTHWCMVSSDTTSTSNASATLVSTCDDPDTFVWWDGLHPTAAAHAAIGAEIAAILEGRL